MPVRVFGWIPHPSLSVPAHLEVIEGPVGWRAGCRREASPYGAASSSEGRGLRKRGPYACVCHWLAGADLPLRRGHPTPTRRLWLWT